MKNIKILIFTLLITFIGLITVNAAGPASDGYIKVGVSNSMVDATMTTTYIYSSSQTIGTVTGLSYNSGNNTLTINNYNVKDKLTEIAINKMGDITINVVGTNSFANGGSVSGSILATNSNLNISGTGTLNFYGVGIRATSSTTTIKDITMNGYPVGDAGVLVSSDSDVTLENVTSKFGYCDPYTGVGFIGKNITIKNSNIKGFGSQPIVATESMNIENSNINVFGFSHYSSFGIGAQGGNITIKNSTITSKNPFNEQWALDLLNSEFAQDYDINELKNEMSPLSITASGSVVINNSDITLGDAALGIKANNITINSGKVTVSTFKGANALGSFILNGGQFIAKDVVYGITAVDDRGTNFGTIELNDGVLDITCMNDEKFNTLSSDSDFASNYPNRMAIYWILGAEETPGIKMSNTLKSFEGGNLFNFVVPEGGGTLYYVSDSEQTFDMAADDPFEGVTFSTRLLVRDKNWTPAAETTNTTTTNIGNVPNTLTPVQIVLLSFGTLLVLGGLGFFIYQTEKNKKKTI